MIGVLITTFHIKLSTMIRIGIFLGCHLFVLSVQPKFMNIPFKAWCGWRRHKRSWTPTSCEFNFVCSNVSHKGHTWCRLTLILLCYAIRVQLRIWLMKIMILLEIAIQNFLKLWLNYSLQHILIIYSLQYEAHAKYNRFHIGVFISVFISVFTSVFITDFSRLKPLFVLPTYERSI